MKDKKGNELSVGQTVLYKGEPHYVEDIRPDMFLCLELRREEAAATVWVALQSHQVNLWVEVMECQN